LSYSAQPNESARQSATEAWLPGGLDPLIANHGSPLLSGTEMGGTETILLVEDEAFVREVASEVLNGAGYVVFTARNAVEALRAFRQCSGKVDLLISDIVLPGKSGHAVASELRQFSPEIRTLLISGYAEQLVVGMAGNKHTPCLAKPFSARVLLWTIRMVLDECEPRAEEAKLPRRACGSE